MAPLPAISISMPSLPRTTPTCSTVTGRTDAGIGAVMRAGALDILMGVRTGCSNIAIAGLAEAMAGLLAAVVAGASVLDAAGAGSAASLFAVTFTARPLCTSFT